MLTEGELVKQKIYENIYFVVVPNIALYTEHMVKEEGLLITEDRYGNAMIDDMHPSTVGLSIYDISVIASRGFSVNLEKSDKLEQTIVGMYDSIKHFQDYYRNRKGLNERDFTKIGDTDALLNDFKNMLYEGHKSLIDNHHKTFTPDRGELPSFEVNDDDSVKPIRIF